MILLIDNYDSFTYNIAQMIGVIGHECTVVRNDKIDPANLGVEKPSAIFLSPGPGQPEEAGQLMDVVDMFAGDVPMFGICLGMQAIGRHFGATVISARSLMHGKTCRIKHDGRGIFTGIDEGLTAMRYHSLALDPITLPSDEIEFSAYAQDGELMGFRHRVMAIEAVQFHPESFATEHGKEMIENFLKQHDC